MSVDIPYNAANEGQVKDRKLDEKAYHKQIQADLAKILSTPEGKRYFWYLITKCGILSSNYSLPENFLYAREGVRSVATELWIEMERANKEALLFMIANHGNQL